MQIFIITDEMIVGFDLPEIGTCPGLAIGWLHAN